MGCGTSSPSYICEDDYSKLSEEVKETIRKDIEFFILYTMYKSDNDPNILQYFRIPNVRVFEVYKYGSGLVHTKKYYSMREFINKDKILFEKIKGILKCLIDVPFIIEIEPRGGYWYGYEVPENSDIDINKLGDRYDFEFNKDKTLYRFYGIKVNIIPVVEPIKRLIITEKETDPQT